MAPSRPLKRQKTNPDVPKSKPAAEVTKPSDQISLPAGSPPEPAQLSTLAPVAKEEPRHSSWYPSWSRKTAPTVLATRESATNLHEATKAETASVMSDMRTPRRASTRSASLAMTLGKAGSNRSLPVDATTSRVNVTSEAKSPTRSNSIAVEGSTDEAGGKSGTTLPESQKPQIEGAKASETTESEGVGKQDALGTGSMRQSGWFAWRSKEELPLRQSEDATGKAKAVPKAEKAKDAAPLETAKPETAKPQDPAPQSAAEGSAEYLDSTLNMSSKRSWLQMLGGDSTTKLVATQGTQSSQQDTTKQEPSKNLEIPASKTPQKSQSQASSIETSPPPALPGDGSKSAGWVFWSTAKKHAPSKSTDQPHEGEIAISGTPSQNRPKRASISVPDEQRPAPKDLKLAKKAEKAASVKSVERPQTPIDEKGTKSTKGKKIESKNATATAIESPRPASPAPSKRAAENLLLPAFHDTLRLEQSPTLLQQLSRLLYYTREPELKHLSLVKEPPRIKSAICIGVHGFFPGPVVRTLLGQPTGTSIKFADMAAKSIRKWTNSRGYDCEVKTAALEGEGKIGERVELLWKLLLNWVDEIRKSDFIMVACHSQGVPVAVMLVAKLIQFGCVNAARVGICAMAGVSMGPFPEYKSRWISGSAGELFEFADTTSKVSQMYQEAVDTVLKSGVRWTLVGSIDDQLVSLESSIFAPITHPHLYRAVSIDSRIHAPGFLSHLVGFVLRLRNLGVQDHGLIRELSSALAGSLYSGEGHSRIYDDEAVYDMAVSFALETTALLGVDVTRRTIQPSGGNPYILPFAMRGILEEDFVKSELRAEVDQLLQQFDDWRPNTKALKDVKFRLEGVRSKL